MKRVSSMLIFVCLIVAFTVTAQAETVYFTNPGFLVRPADVINNYYFSFPGSKSDGEGAYYVRLTNNGFPDGRNIYFRAVHTNGYGGGMDWDSTPVVSNHVTLSQNNTRRSNTYMISVSTGDSFALACRTGTYAGDPYAQSYYGITGRWTP